MKRALLSLSALIGALWDARAQDIGANESVIQYDPASSSFVLSWLGDPVRSYFYVLYSEDLVTWAYFPIVEFGTAGLIQWGFTSTATQLYLKVVKMEQSPFVSDVDDDDMIDAWEVLNGLRPDGDDSAADSDGDGLTNKAEHDLNRNPSKMDNPAVGLSVFGFASP